MAPASGVLPRKRLLQQLPWLRQVLPQVAKHLQALRHRPCSRPEDATVDWPTFRRLCTFKRQRQDLHKQSILEVYDVVVEECPSTRCRGSFPTALLLRDPQAGPRLKCEPLNPCCSIHHQAHRAEWRIRGMSEKVRCTPPGEFIGSRVFAAGGVAQLFLRFWPSGYLSSIQKRQKYRYTCKLVSGWCCLGLYAPIGTALKVRLFIGGYASEAKDIYFEDKAMHPEQLWEPPQLERSFAPGEELVVGVDVLENLRDRRRMRPREGRRTALGASSTLSRSLSDLAPSAWLSEADERQAAACHEGAALTGLAYSRAKRLYPLRTNLASTLGRSKSAI